MEHGEILRDEGPHAMPKQDGRYFYKSLRQVFIDEQGVRDQQGPAAFSRKISRVITVSAVTALVVNADSKTARVCSACESCIAIPVLTHAMQNLNYATQ